MVLPRFRDDGAVVAASSDGWSYKKSDIVFVFEGAALVWDMYRWSSTLKISGTYNI